jgi:hypothetical protein
MTDLRPRVVGDEPGLQPTAPDLPIGVREMVLAGCLLVKASRP